MRSKTVASVLVLVAFAVIQGCSSSEPANNAAGSKGKAAKSKAAASASGIPASAVAEAKSIYSTRCATCHGATGRGDGPGSTNLDPKPRDYSNAEWQKSVTDEDIEKTIVYGGAAVGKSPVMVANPDLSNKPDVVKGLREMVRSFGK